MDSYYYRYDRLNKFLEIFKIVNIYLKYYIQLRLSNDPSKWAIERKGQLASWMRKSTVESARESTCIYPTNF